MAKNISKEYWVKEQTEKPAVSAHVQRLEERLGVRLLNRTTRRLSVTEAGAAFYRHCARIVAEAEAAEQVASTLQREPRGTLRISAPDSFGWTHVAPAVPAFLKRYPELAVDITLSPGAREPRRRGTRSGDPHRRA